MYNKIYDKIKVFINKNYKFIITFILLYVIFTFNLPYYIDIPGGMTSVADRFSISDEYPIDKNFNTAYVYSISADIPSIIYALINPDWDISPYITTQEQENEEYGDKLMLKYANQDAILYAFNKAGKKASVISEDIYIVSIDENAKTDLKIGDQLLMIDTIKINSREDNKKVDLKNKLGQIINIKVKRNGAEINCYAKVLEKEGKFLIGIYSLSDRIIETDPKVNQVIKESESGPSGGFMKSLALYSALIKEDLTKGRVIAGTGTIDIEGNVGTIGGVKYKLIGAVKQKAEIFLVPAGENYDEAIRIKEQKKYKIEIVAIEKFDDALAYLRK